MASFTVPEKFKGAADKEADDIADIRSRLIRIETRISKLLIHLGLNADGTDRNGA